MKDLLILNDSGLQVVDGTRINTWYNYCFSSSLPKEKCFMISWHERLKGCSTRARDAGWEEREKFTQIYTFYNLLLTWLHYLSWQACLLRLRIYPQLTNRSLTLMQRPGEFTDIPIQASCPSICKYFKPQGRFQKYEKVRCVLSRHD